MSGRRAKAVAFRPTIPQLVREFLADFDGVDPYRSRPPKSSGVSEAVSDDPVVAHLPDVVVLQAEEVAKDFLVLRADAFAEPADFRRALRRGAARRRAPRWRTRP